MDWKNRPRKGQKNLMRLGDFLPGILKKKRIYIDLESKEIRDAWDDAVGPMIASNTNPCRLKNGTLFVKVSTSTWMQQLQFMKREIMEKVNSAFKAEQIKNIYFSIGEMSVRLPEKKKDDISVSGQHALKERDKRMIKENLSSVDDKELKDILKKVMTKEIINRRINEDR